MNCEECENLMDEFFHHELSFKVKRQIRGHLKSCPKCQAVSQEYDNMLQELRSLEVHRCPNVVVEKVFDILNLAEGPGYRISLLEKFVEFLNRYRLRTGLVGAAVLIILAMIIIYPRLSQKPHVKQQYSEVQIEQAKDQVKMALAYFNEITSRTQRIIEEQVLPQQVIKPMKSSIRTAIKPLIDGGES